MPHPIWALVPVKQLDGAKARLNPHLSEGERTELSRAMLRDVLTALESTSGLAGAAVITADDSAAQIAHETGAAWIKDKTGSLNDALALGARVLAGYGAKGVMFVHGDLPLANPLSFQAVIDAAPVPGATLVPAGGDGGTNVMLLAPHDTIPLAYGKDSFAKHKQAADDAELPLAIVDPPGLGLDIDRPEDLKALIDAGPHGFTAEYLKSSGLEEQLQKARLTV